MKLIFWIIMVLTAVVVILFTVENRSVVEISFWPLSYNAQLPLYAIVLLSVFCGFCIGGVVSHFSGWGDRRRARAVKRELRRNKLELAAMVKAEEQKAATNNPASRSTGPTPQNKHGILPPPSPSTG